MLKQKQDYQEFEDSPPYLNEHVIPEDEVETVYLYAYTEDPEQSSVWNRDRLIGGLTVFLVLALLVGLGLAGSVLPSTDPFTVQTITVPAQFVTQELQTSVAIVPTGTKTLAAIRATGMLTIYNGSFLTEQIPAGFVVSTQSGIEIVTDQAVIVPGANLPTLGIVEVSAHAVMPGASGNIAPYAVRAQYGSSLSLKNLTAFTGGQDARAEHYVTSQDRQTALVTARHQLATRKQTGMQIQPCTEVIKQAPLALAVAWTCRFAHYHLPPGLQVLSVQFVGTNVLVRVKVTVPVLLHPGK